VMTEEDPCCFTMAFCHQCQRLVSLVGDGFIHLDGTPLCKELTSDNQPKETK